MKKQLLVLSFLLTSSIVFLPVQGNAAPAAAKKVVPPQIVVQVGRNRGRHLGWYKHKHHGRFYRTSNVYYTRRVPPYARTYRSGMVRQTYYVNGRRYTRWVNY